MRSQAGFSGAPVFLSIPPFSWRGELGDGTVSATTTIVLLGIDTGHVQHREPVRANSASQADPEYYVNDNAGIAIVAPSWKIDEVLKDETLVEQRRLLAASLDAPGTSN
jgi:hypothetical protein